MWDHRTPNNVFGHPKTVKTGGLGVRKDTLVVILRTPLIGHVVSITWDNEYNYIYPNFTSSDINVNESIGTVVKDVDISVLGKHH